MTAEQSLRDVTTRLEAAKKVVQEKRLHFKAARRGLHTPGGYAVFCVAAVGYASAANDLEDLHDQFEEAVAEAQAELIRRENDGLPLDQEMNMRAAQGDQEAQQWVYRNLK